MFIASFIPEKSVSSETSKSIPKSEYPMDSAVSHALTIEAIVPFASHEPLP